MGLFKKKAAERVKTKEEIEQEKQTKTLETIEAVKIDNPECIVRCKEIEEYNIPRPVASLGFKIYATKEGMIKAIVYPQEYDTLYLTETNEHYKIEAFDLNHKVPSQRFYFGEPRYLDSAEFYQMQDAQEWVDNWCENAKIHKLWIDQQYRKGDLNCSN